jgi:hypothetical protein
MGQRSLLGSSEGSISRPMIRERPSPRGSLRRPDVYKNFDYQNAPRSLKIALAAKRPALRVYSISNFQSIIHKLFCLRRLASVHTSAFITHHFWGRGFGRSGREFGRFGRGFGGSLGDLGRMGNILRSFRARGCFRLVGSATLDASPPRARTQTITLYPGARGRFRSARTWRNPW